MRCISAKAGSSSQDAPTKSSAGIGVGSWMGRELVVLYQQFFRFPVLEFRLEAQVALVSVGVSLIAALAGALASVRSVARLPPAEAMRPPAPAVYKKTFVERLGLQRWLQTGAQMVLREIQRRPVRLSLSSLGIAMAVAILVVGRFFHDSITYLMDVHFQQSMREDLAVTLYEPEPMRAKRDLAHLPGVRRAEGLRMVPVRFRAGPRKRDSAIVGYPNGGELRSRVETEARVQAARARARQTETAIERAKAALEHARGELERHRRLHERGGVSQSALERAQLDVRTRKEELASARFAARVAEHELEMARAALQRLEGDPGGDKLEVTAPVNGVVLDVMNESEGVVQPGTPLLEVGDPKALEIVVDVLTSDAVKIEPGDEARISEWGGGRPLDARVRRVEPSAFEKISALGVEEQRVNVILDLAEPYEHWSRLGDGFRIQADIVIWEAQNVLRVPASAVFRHEGGWALYVVRDGTVHLTPVRIGKRNGRAVQIQDGVTPGTRVVLYPGDRVRDGIRVHPR